MVRPAQFRGKFLWLLLVLQACAGKTGMPEYNAATLHVAMQNGLLVQHDKPFTGIIYGLQTNSRDTAYKVCFNRGREHGQWKKFYADGKPMEQRQFDNGIKTGELKEWWPNGVLKLDYNFKDGEYNGRCREWADNGTLVAQMNYSKGYEAGPQVQYYSNGKIKANYIITDGRRYGLLGTKNCVNVTDSVFKN